MRANTSWVKVSTAARHEQVRAHVHGVATQGSAMRYGASESLKLMRAAAPLRLSPRFVAELWRDSRESEGARSDEIG